jgi:hypothetical protein
MLILLLCSYFFLFCSSLSLSFQNVRKSSSQHLVLLFLRFLRRREGQNTYTLSIGQSVEDRWDNVSTQVKKLVEECFPLKTTKNEYKFFMSSY